MAIGNPASTNTWALKRTASLPTSTSFTMSGWVMIRNYPTAGNYANLIGLDNGGASGFMFVQVQGSTWIMSTDVGETSFASSPSANTWVYIAMVNSGTTGTSCVGYWALRGDTAFTSKSTTGKSFAASNMWWSNDFANEPLDSIWSDLKVWDAVLTEAELFNEMHSAQPQKLANLHLWAPCWGTGDANDYSGNAKNLTQTGTLTTEAAAPVGDQPLTFTFPHATATGSAPSSAPTITVEATGASLFKADASSAPTISVAPTGSSNAQSDPSSAPTVSVAPTGASLATGAPSSSPTITVDATSAALKAAAASSSPSITVEPVGASLMAGAPSCAPTITVTATSTSGSDPSSAPSVSVAATGAALGVGAPSSAPTITVDAVGSPLAAGAPSSAPTITVNGTYAALFPAAPSSAPTITVGGIGASLATAAPSCTPSITVNATSTAPVTDNPFQGFLVL